MSIRSPYELPYGVTYDGALTSGYRSKDEIMKLKGFSDWQHFCVHYVVYVNFDETGAFYNVLKRKR